ncbi:MAG: ATP-dependent Clp protease adaptor ClpS, partial [Alphaproteobacteria bacterium]|nr:ATP-dependent Clp protease adaptor ClpS [Alphaproteobacteria bacterium]
MDALAADATLAFLSVHDDDDTPATFVVELMQRVFGKSEQEAFAFVSQVDQQGSARCGPYPLNVASALLQSSQACITAAGHKLRVTMGAMKTRCDLCGAAEVTAEVAIRGGIAGLCGTCVLTVKRASSESLDEKFSYACDAIDWHFADVQRGRLVTTARDFPGHMRADVQLALDTLLASPVLFFGIHEDHRYEMLSFSHLMRSGRAAQAIAPPQYQDV